MRNSMLRRLLCIYTMLLIAIVVEVSGCSSIATRNATNETVVSGTHTGLHSRWALKASMPTARSGITAGVIDGVIYAIGCCYGSQGRVSDAAYDPTTDSWSIKAPMSSPRSTLAVGVIAGTLYAAGGCCDINGFGLNTVDAYVPHGPAANSWTSKAAMPTPRFGLAGGVINGILYAVGGAYDVNGGSTLNTVEAYDPAPNTWSTKAAMPTPRAGLAVSVVNGILYAIGGCDNKTTNPHNYNTVEAYDPAKDSWTTKTPMPTARQYPAAGVINGIIYVTGGYNVYELSTVEAYNPTTDSWTSISPMLEAGDGMAAAVIGGKLYVAGGWNGKPLNTSEAFTPR